MTPAMFERVRRWTFEDALPLWSRLGLDGRGRGFVERLDITGRPDEAGFKRMRVQARQIYVFSHAHVLGWSGGLAATEAGYRFIVEHGRLEGGGWARTLAPDGAVLDPTFDLYDQAFVLFALAWLHRATGDIEPLRLADETMAAIETRLARPDRHGYRSADPDLAGEGLQNPHMHLLEAMLAWFEATGDARWTVRATELASLFQARLFDPATTTLAERFDENWGRAQPAAVEPGHHCEWAWLLARLGRATGADYRAEIDGLLAFAFAHGADPANGLAWDEVSETGAVVMATHRLWPQTELLKAMLARAEMTGAPDHAAIARTTGAIFDRYLDPAPRGGWRDRLDAQGRDLGGPIPASSFYHLFLAFSELLRLEPLLTAAS